MGRLKVGKKKRVSLKTVVSTIIIGFAIVCFWRGVWGLMDLYLFPSNLALSFIVSVLLGIGILYSTKHLLDELI